MPLRSPQRCCILTSQPVKAINRHYICSEHLAEVHPLFAFISLWHLSISVTGSNVSMSDHLTKIHFSNNVWHKVKGRLCFICITFGDVRGHCWIHDDYMSVGAVRSTIVSLLWHINPFLITLIIPVWTFEDRHFLTWLENATLIKMFLMIHPLNKMGQKENGWFRVRYTSKNASDNSVQRY